MAITNYLVHFTTEATYNDKKSELRNDAVAFVKDATIIHTHGTDYYCGSGPVALKSDLSGYATTSALTSGLAGKANTSHTHTISQVSGLQDELDSKLESADLSGYALKTDIPSLSGGASATSGQYVSGVTVSGHKVTVTKANLPSVSLSSLGVTATAAELNYMDGVTSSVQTQLNGKAASSHTHTASQVSGLATVATSGSYDDLTDKPSIPAAITIDSALSSTSINPVQNKVINSALAGKAASSHTHTAANITDLADAIESTVGGWGDEWAEAILSGELKTTATNQITKLTGYVEGSSITTLTESMTLNAALASLQNQIQDAKHCTGTSNSPNKLYLAGSLSQSSTGVRTYSNSLVYTQAGQLYAAQMNATNGFYETSDARLKNFKDDIKALNVVSEIPTKYFTWKKDETDDPKLHIGTSAQEIQKLYPDLVTENEEGELSVDYARLSIIALAAIKELKAELENIKKSK